MILVKNINLETLCCCKDKDHPIVKNMHGAGEGDYNEANKKSRMRKVNATEKKKE